MKPTTFVLICAIPALHSHASALELVIPPAKDQATASACPAATNSDISITSIVVPAQNIVDLDAVEIDAIGIEVPEDPGNARFIERRQRIPYVPPSNYRVGVLILPGNKLIVKGVANGSPAKKAGIQQEDEILKINRIKLANYAALTGIISAAGAQELEFTLKRGNAEMVVSLTPEKAKPMGQADATRDFQLPSIQVDRVEEVRPSPANNAAKATDLLHVPRPKNNSAKVADIVRVPQGHANHDHSPDRSEQLLSEILAEMKKMNRREDAKTKAQATPRIRTLLPGVEQKSSTSSTQLQPSTRTRWVAPPQSTRAAENAAATPRETGRRVVLPPKKATQKSTPPPATPPVESNPSYTKKRGFVPRKPPVTDLPATKNATPDPPKNR
jgi:hypothetical protein